MAEAMLRQTLADRRIDTVEISSGGLVANSWGVAHNQLRRVLGPTYRLIENRKSQPLTNELMDSSDLILGMESRHVAQILERFPKTRGRVDKITTYSGREGEIRDFPDSGFSDIYSWLRYCHSIMVPCVEFIADRLVRGQGARPELGKVD